MAQKAKHAFKQFMSDEKGASTIEYVIGAAVMALLAAGVYSKLKASIDSAADTTGGAIDQAIQEASKR